MKPNKQTDTVGIRKETDTVDVVTIICFENVIHNPLLLLLKYKHCKVIYT